MERKEKAKDELYEFDELLGLMWTENSKASEARQNTVHSTIDFFQ